MGMTYRAKLEKNLKWGIIEVKSDKRRKWYTGQVTEITIKIADKYQLLQVDDTLGISLTEELNDE